MDKKITDLIGENTVLKNEVAELKKSLQFHTDQWKENFKTFDNLKNKLLRNQKYKQQQSVMPDLKEIKDKLNDLENRSRKNNLRINSIIEEQNESCSQSKKKLQEVVKDSYSSNGTLKFDVHTVVEKKYRKNNYR